MQRKKFFFYLFLLLSVVNVCIFLNRDQFRYEIYSNYQSFYEPCDETCRDKWESFVDDYPQTELIEAKKISDSIYNGNTATFSKILGIGHFLRQRFEKQLGKPSLELLTSTPLQQFKKLSSSDTVQLWCGNFAQMFSWFCWSQGIITRNIEIMKAGDHHVVSECYVPEEKRWVMVDLTSNLLATRVTDNGHFANFMEFRSYISRNDHFLGFRSEGDSIFPRNINSLPLREYYNENHPAIAYHGMNYEKKITLFNKIRQYLFPVSWYEILTEKKSSNLLFYLKLALIVLWLGSFFVFLFSRTKFKL